METEQAQPQEAKEEPQVEFHKPKPWHNWREFLKEYVIIVVGVLTALAAEQAVEWLHWQSEVTVARKALAAEIALNGSYFARRHAIGPCVQKQIDETKAILTALEAGKPPPPFTRYQFGMGSVARRWRMAISTRVADPHPFSP